MGRFTTKLAAAFADIDPLAVKDGLPEISAWESLLPRNFVKDQEVRHAIQSASPSETV